MDVTNRPVFPNYEGNGTDVPNAPATFEGGGPSPASLPARDGSRIADRITGVVVLVVSVWYWWIAGDLDHGFGDPVGPTAFPRLVAVSTALLAAFLIFRPDPDARWWHGRQSIEQLLGLAALCIYPLMIESLGFPISTAISAGALALVFGARPLAAIGLGVASGLVLFVMFDMVLGLPLPAWPDWG